jgi:hypothetical protein
MNGQADAACALADHCALLEGVIDALNAVTLAADEEAAAELGARCAGVEQGGGGMCEPALTAAQTARTAAQTRQPGMSSSARYAFWWPQCSAGGQT